MRPPWFLGVLDIGALLCYTRPRPAHRNENQIADADTANNQI